MRVSHWLRSVVDRVSRPPSRRVRPRPAFRPRMEVLEERSVPAIFTVTSTADGGTGSLRQAILDTNAAPGADEIRFALPDSLKTPGTDWWTIKPTNFLPPIVGQVFIDGYSQTGASRNTLTDGNNAILKIELDCSLVPVTNGNSLSVAAGLHLTTSDSTITGLVINRFALGSGIMVEGGGNNHIQGNFIGTDVDGRIEMLHLPTKFTGFSGVTPYGIHLVNTHSNWIGVRSMPGDPDHSPTPGERNVISGVNYGVGDRDATGTVIAGNFIGTDRTGTQRVGNFVGIAFGPASFSRIGTNGDGFSDELERNVISGNRYGIVFSATSDPDGASAHDITVAGNSIGTDWFGKGVASEMGNVGTGIGALTGTYNVTIGGDTPVMANVIAYNGNEELFSPGAGRPNGPGVAVLRFARPATGIRILGNSIHDNYGLGIDLNNNPPSPTVLLSDGVTANDLDNPLTLAVDPDWDSGPNGLQNFPDLDSVTNSTTHTRVTGELNSAADTVFTLHFYASAAVDPSGHGEGERYLGSGSVTTNASGYVAFDSDNFSVTLGASIPGEWITATATDPDGNTSEFSLAVRASGSVGSVKDSYLRSGSDNTNEGANPYMQIASSGHNRAIVGFDLSNVSLVGLTRATLVLTLADNADNWGTTGRTVDAHRLLVDWTEGNGINSIVPGPQQFRGTGAGVTWNLASDANVSNSSPDGSPQWNGGTSAAATAPSVLHKNGQQGEVTWDVTQDVLAGAPFGWIIKKTNEGNAGKVQYYSREGAAQAGNPLYAPRLILEFGGHALHAGGAGPDNQESEPLSLTSVEPVLQEAIARWNPDPLNASVLATLQVRIADLGGTTLGLASGNTIWLDDDAAGWGWFVDPTPSDDSEFTTPGDQGEMSRMDLLTVLMHEIGHILGFGHDEGVMHETLEAGVREAQVPPTESVALAVAETGGLVSWPANVLVVPPATHPASTAVPRRATATVVPADAAFASWADLGAAWLAQLLDRNRRH